MSHVPWWLLSLRPCQAQVQGLHRAQEDLAWPSVILERKTPLFKVMFSYHVKQNRCPSTMFNYLLSCLASNHASVSSLHSLSFCSKGRGEHSHRDHSALNLLPFLASPCPTAKCAHSFRKLTGVPGRQGCFRQWCRR